MARELKIVDARVMTEQCLFGLAPYFPKKACRP